MKSIFKSINPKNNKIIKSYPQIKPAHLDKTLQQASDRFYWKINKADAALEGRFVKLDRLRFVLSANRHKLGDLIVNEVGKCRT